MDVEIRFPGEKRIEAQLKGQSMVTGKEGDDASEGAGIEPLDLFFVSLGLCAGKYVMAFCQSRDIPYKEAKVKMETVWDEKKKLHTNVVLKIQLPVDFPAKYKKAILKAVDLCSVKRHILEPPAFDTEVIIGL